MAEARRASGAGDDGSWARTRARLRREFGETVYRNWIRPLTLERVANGAAVVVASTPFRRDRVAAQFGERLRAAWMAESGGAVREVEVRAPAEGGVPAPGEAAEPARAGAAAPGADPAGPAQGEEPESRYTFENFVVGAPNELAFRAARRVADRAAGPAFDDGALSFNPLFLHGSHGLGKTHLMRAIAWEIRRRAPERRVIYLSAESFMNQFTGALRGKGMAPFKARFRSADVLMVDDIHFLGGKSSTQEEFLHTFNDLMDRGRRVAVASVKPPADLDGLEDSLRSRLGAGLTADIHPTTYELRLDILRARAGRLEIPVPAPVLEFLAHKIASNVRDLEGALTSVVAHATLAGRDISTGMVREALRDMLRAHDRRATVDEIQRRIADHYRIRLSDMLSARRSRAVARPRQVAMYLARELTPHSLPDLGRRFGGRDHTTVLYAVRKIDDLRAADPRFADEVDMLRRMLEA